MSQPTVTIDPKWEAKGLCYKTIDEWCDSDWLIDGNIPLTLWTSHHWLAVAAVTSDLDDYFDCFFEDREREWYIKHGYVAEDGFDAHARAADKARGLFGIIQMQAMPETQLLRGGIEYHDILLQGLMQLAQKQGFEIAYYLPARLNRFIMPNEVWESSMTPRYEAEFLRNLKKNYDQVALRNEFVFDEESGLFMMN